MRHDRVRAASASLLVRKRFQFAGALLIAAWLPWFARGPLPGSMTEPASLNALAANAVAVMLAFWTRLSIETYPGIRRSSVILPAALTGHGVAVVWFVLTRFPYDRLGLAAGSSTWPGCTCSTFAPSGKCGGGSRLCRSVRSSD